MSGPWKVHISAQVSGLHEIRIRQVWLHIAAKTRKFILHQILVNLYHTENKQIYIAPNAFFLFQDTLKSFVLNDDDDEWMKEDL